jgi:hypothetical protein
MRLAAAQNYVFNFCGIKLGSLAQDIPDTVSCEIFWAR